MHQQSFVDPTLLQVEAHREKAWLNPPSFQDVVAEQLAHAPWLAVSLVVHAVIGAILWQIPVTVHTGSAAVVIQTQQDAEAIIAEEPEEEEEEVVEEAADPVLQDSEAAIVAEETVEEFTEDEPDPDTNFEDDAFNDVIGIGGGASGKFGGRGSGRERLRKKRGFPSAEAIRLGLEWLNAHQSSQGHWGAETFATCCPKNSLCSGAGVATNDVGITALALLAFLGDGSTMRSGPYRSVVKRATMWLRSQQDEKGLVGVQAGPFMYNHALASLAIVEAYGLSKYRTLKRCAQRAVDWILEARNPHGVWRYYPGDGQNDSSVTGWMVFVLKSAQDFGLRVDQHALADSLAWFDRVTDPRDGRCGYRKLGQPSAREPAFAAAFPASKTEALTAVGLLCRIFLGQTPESNPLLGRAAATMLQKPPVWYEADGSIDLYYWYYGSYAMFQIGGDQWRKWRRRLEPALIKTQRRSGHALGSWDPVSAWGHVGGRVYSTAMAVLCLEVYYRYTRLIR